MDEQPHNSGPLPGPEEPEPVWTYRGYRLRSSEFTTAMVHFFRAEIQRANIWRTRLDTTTNWAVVTTGAIITFAFSEPTGHHSVIILSTLLISLFLGIEARRYRYYELWSSRIRLMETDFFAAMLVPPFHPAADWADSLAENLLQPHFPISMWEAVGRRLRRNYLWIFLILWAAWIAKIWLHPTTASSVAEMIDRAAIGQLSGWLIFTFGVIYLVGLFLMALLTIGLHAASGEILPRFFPVESGRDEVPAGADPMSRLKAWFRPKGQRQQLMALIVTDQGPAVADRILREMSRGVTGLPGQGMYTGAAHSVLICALTVTEVNQLKHIVSQIDERAFMIVAPVREVLGKGFAPMDEL